MAAALAAADVVAVPSVVDRAGNVDGLPNALLEALAAGTGGGGHAAWPASPTSCEHGVNGLLVPPGDAAALAGALRRLRREPAHARAAGRGGAAPTPWSA